MQPEKNEPKPSPDDARDRLAEPRDHANQWDLSAIWLEPKREPQEPKRGPVQE